MFMLHGRALIFWFLAGCLLQRPHESKRPALRRAFRNLPEIGDCAG
jgi:hypothetical protein